LSTTFHSEDHVSLSFYSLIIILYSLYYFAQKTDSKTTVNGIISALGLIESNRLDHRFRLDKVLSPDTVFGNQYLVENYLKEMTQIFDDTYCYEYECVLAVHNYIWYYVYALYLPSVTARRFISNAGLDSTKIKKV